MVISAAARAAIKAARIIKAKKAVKPRVKKAVKPIVKKRVKPSVRNKDGSITKYHKDGSVSITGPRWVKPKPASDSMSDYD